MEPKKLYGWFSSLAHNQLRTYYLYTNNNNEEIICTMITNTNSNPHNPDSMFYKDSKFMGVVTNFVRKVNF